MSTLAAVLAKDGLWRQLWLIAVDEAYNAKDSLRRFSEINGRLGRDVVEVYFTYHPEMREWAEDHVKAGTCEAAIIELQETLKAVRAQRSADRQRVQEHTQRGLPTAPIDDQDDWMARFESGPAIWPTYRPRPSVIEEAPVARPAVVMTPIRPKGTDQALQTWVRERVGAWPDDQVAPTEAADWAAAKEYFAPGLIRQKFRAARADATPASWRKQGRQRPWGEAKLNLP
jgi:hypothetical protein